MSGTTKIGSYLLGRLKELGVKTIFGVPGDFELTLLDLVPEAGLKFHGTANELVAAYAADGYARFNGFGAVITTFGPGELSALNGLAGAYAESVPVLHIIGYPSTKAHKQKAMVHHTMGDGRYDAYHEMSKHISCATAVLQDPKDATSEIDRVLNAMLYYGRPGYIGILTDMITRPIQNVPEAISTIVPNGQQDGIEDVAKPVAAIRDKILSAKKLAIIADSGVTRHGITNETWELINLLQAPYFTTPMGKGGLTEADKNYGGIYAGIASDPAAKEYVETADCVLRIGNVPSDLNTAIFSTKYQPKALVDIRQFSVNLDGRTLDANIKHLIPSLKNDLQSNSQTQSLSWPTCPSRLEEKILPPKDLITFDWFLQRLGQAFRPGDLIVAETGSVSIGISQVPLPEGATMFTQTLWGSIGYAVGASVGAFCAAKEQSQRYKRSILIVGDGSFQMTVQAVSDLVHLNPIIIVLNNAGYACERVFNGPNASYNDIREWDWQSLLRTFGPKVQSRSFRAKTPQELDALLSDPEIAEAKCAQLLEVVMEKHDVPKALKVCGEAVIKANSE